MRQHTSAYVLCLAHEPHERVAHVVALLHTSAYASIRQHTSAYVSICLDKVGVEFDGDSVDMHVVDALV
jgi:hypothetical protein